MPSRKRFILYSFIILLLGAGWIGVSAPPAGIYTSQPPVARKGIITPDFEAVTLDGKTLHLKDLRGKPVILNLWASWRPPCKAEMPALQSVYADYTPRRLVMAFGIWQLFRRIYRLKE